MHYLLHIKRFRPGILIRSLRNSSLMFKMIAIFFAWEMVCTAAEQERDISQIPTSALQTEASRLVSGARFAEAVPLLKELSRRYEGGDSVESKKNLDNVLYYLGVASMQIDKTSEAIDAFEKYMLKLPKGNHIRHAIDLCADCHRRVESYQDAATLYERLRADYPLEPEFMYGVMMKLASCYVSLRQWDKAVPLLETLWQQAFRSGPELRGKVVTALVQAYIETDQAEKIFALLPALQSRASSSRFDFDFNMALVHGGDRVFAKKNYPMALLFYQLTLPKEELLVWCDQREAFLGEERKRSMLMGGDVSLQSLMGINDELARLKSQRQSLKENESYTEHLRLRLARTYYEEGRKWEALWTFWSVWKDFPKNELAEEGLYAAFSLAAEMGFDDRAKELGYTYMKEYPKEANHYDEVSMQLGQVLLRKEEFDKTIDLYQKTLETKPDHTYSDQLAFSIGYTLFQQEQYDRALAAFSSVRKKYPNSTSREMCDYWLALTYLFKKDFKSAKEEFSEFVEKYLSGEYCEDAFFRVGVAQYGLLEFPEAKKQFESFIRKYPASRLRPEAHALLGDIAGADGKLDEAIEQYRKVEAYADPSNMTHINYAAMQIGKILELKKDYKGMYEFFQQYLRKWELKGLYTEAIWRIGFAKKQMGDTKGMLDEYFKAIKQYGDDPSAIGIDLILDDWPQQYAAFHGKDPRELLAQELAKAEAANQKALVLRMKMAIFKAGKVRVLPKKDSKDAAPSSSPTEGTDSSKPKWNVNFDIKEGDISQASPAVLIWIGEQNPNLARKAYQRVLDVYNQTEWSEPALVRLAEVEAAEKNYAGAIDLFKQVQERFPASSNAGVAMKRQADLLREQRKFNEAVALYQKVLEVKEWRGPLWAESIYQVGICLLEQGKIKEAFAYFQRVYVLYQNYAEWVARAYLQSAQCLEKLNQRQDAIQTYKEMLALEKLKDRPEYREAEQRLSKLQ